MNSINTDRHSLKQSENHASILEKTGLLLLILHM